MNAIAKVKPKYRITEEGKLVPAKKPTMDQLITMMDDAKAILDEKNAAANKAKKVYDSLKDQMIDILQEQGMAKVSNDRATLSLQPKLQIKITDRGALDAFTSANDCAEIYYNQLHTEKYQNLLTLFPGGVPGTEVMETVSLRHTRLKPKL